MRTTSHPTVVSTVENGETVPRLTVPNVSCGYRVIVAVVLVARSPSE
jgi:hypothetical protein